MKRDAVQIVFSVVGLIAAAACQDAVPPFGGVKIPFLSVFPLCVALGADADARAAADRTGRFASRRWLWTALAAGLMMDALGGLPFGCCTGLLVALCAGARLVRPFAADVPPAVAGMCAGALAGAAHEMWLHAWGVPGDGPLVIRAFVGVLLGGAAGHVLAAALPRIERRIGLREEAG